ncbi:MAG: glycosyltransferase [Deltaproteobacteria bacterium]|jgi:spore maturation protein CgeB|nr:glycosyltransferase [Deltaproteobacteria bacterium]
MPNPLFLEKAQNAFLARGDSLAAAFLGAARKDPLVKVEYSPEKDPFLNVGGVFQDSPRNPRGTVEKFLAQNYPDLQGEVFLFGLGSPLLGKLLGEKALKLSVFECFSTVARTFFSLYDLESEIKSGRLSFFSPWSLAQATPLPRGENLTFITHPGSLRASPGLYHKVRLNLVGPRLLPTPSAEPSFNNLKPKFHESLKLMIVPPFSGGSLSLGFFLKKAAEILRIPVLLLDYSQELKNREKILREQASAPEKTPAKLLKTLFQDSAQEVFLNAKNFKPHLILALAQAPLDLEGLVLLKEKLPQTLLAFWFVEDYLRFTYFRDLAPLYDLFFHIQGPLFQEVSKDLGLLHAHYLPLAADPDFFRPQKSLEKYQALVSFMGAPYPNRRQIFLDLVENYWEKQPKPLHSLKIFGAGWKNCHPKLQPYIFENGRRITTAESALIYSGGTINLNIHSGSGMGFCPESGFVNPRTFEIAASGAFQLLDKRSLLGDLFDTNEVVSVEDPGELPELIEFYLNNPKLREKMGEASRQQILRSHLFTHRLKTIIKLAKTASNYG